MHAEVGARGGPQLLLQLVQCRRDRAVLGHPFGGRDNAVYPATEGHGADYAFDAIGGDKTAVTILEALAAGGHAVIVGIPSFATRAAIAPVGMVYGEKTLSGTYYGSIRPAIDFGVLADLAMDKRIDLDNLISRTYKFDEINEGFRLLTTGAVARGVIVF